MDSILKYLWTFSVVKSKFGSKPMTIYYFDVAEHNYIGNRSIEIPDIFVEGSMCVFIRNEYKDKDDYINDDDRKISPSEIPNDIAVKFIEYVFNTGEDGFEERNRNF